MEKKELKIGIIGVGILGGTLKKYFLEKGYEVRCYDKFKPEEGTIEGVNELDFNDPIFVCVPTPCDQNRECDTSIVKEVIGCLTGIKTIIIKSTVTPGTTEELQKKHLNHAILFNPEFLTESRAYIDFTEPKQQIIGYTLRSEGKVLGIKGILPLGTIKNLKMPATEAEMFKLARNSWLGVKNSFWNDIYDACQKAGIDYNRIREAAEADLWIGPEHLEIWHKEKRGYNGKCLPKDTEAFFNWARKIGVKLRILGESIKSNSERLASQGIEKDS